MSRFDENDGETKQAASVDDERKRGCVPTWRRPRSSNAQALKVLQGGNLIASATFQASSTSATMVSVLSPDLLTVAQC